MKPFFRFDQPSRSTAALLVMVSGLALPALSQAQDLSSSPAGSTAEFGHPVDISTLENARGGAEVVSNDMKLVGATAGNLAVNVETGTNAINGGAFANLTGLPVVIQNSGANVLIQNAMIVNLQLN